MKEAPETRHSLLLRLQTSCDPQAWDEFVEIYEPLVYRLARAKGLQHADALDLSQEVLAAVHRAIDHFEYDPNRGSFRSWLNTIARNLAINFLTRRKGPVGVGDTAHLTLMEQQPAPDDASLANFQLEYQRELLRVAAERVQHQFAKDTWKAFWLTGVEGQSIESVARQLEKSVGAIRIARCRVLAKIKCEVDRIATE